MRLITTLFGTRTAPSLFFTKRLSNDSGKPDHCLVMDLIVFTKTYTTRIFLLQANLVRSWDYCVGHPPACPRSPPTLAHQSNRTQSLL